MSRANRIGLQTQPFMPEIIAGRLNKSETVFLDKQPITTQAVYAVGDYVLRHAGGSLVTEIDGMIIYINVKMETKK